MDDFIRKQKNDSNGSMESRRHVGNRLVRQIVASILTVIMILWAGKSAKQD